MVSIGAVQCVLLSDKLVGVYQIGWCNQISSIIWRVLRVGSAGRFTLLVGAGSSD